jgi:hypothetical protein
MELSTLASATGPVGRKPVCCRSPSIIFVFFVLILSLCLLIAPAAACPACQEAVGDNARLTEGFARSIYLLMSAPYLLFAGLMFYVIRSGHRKK